MQADKSAFELIGRQAANIDLLTRQLEELQAKYKTACEVIEGLKKQDDEQTHLHPETP